MPRNLATCRDCAREIVIAVYVPDLARTGRPNHGRGKGGRHRSSYMPLDVVPCERDDEQAPYALSIGRTRCHLITEDWPLESNETRHTIHFQTCPARATSAPATRGVPR